MLCRICQNNNLVEVLSLGSTPLANSFLSKENLNQPEQSYPLVLCFCNVCKLIQLSEVIDPKILFKDYVYSSSTGKSFREHFSKMANEIKNNFNLTNESLVVDIGSNDGILLKPFNDLGLKTIGVEPATNIAKIAESNGVDTINDFFNVSSVNTIIQNKGKADVVTANNVFAHIDNIKEVITNVKLLLKENGIFIIEFQYFVDTIQKMTFDNIYHEHVSYYTLTALNYFFNKNDLEVFKVQRVDSHGGSLRVFVQKSTSNKEIDSSVNEILQMEKELGVDSIELYKNFATKVHEIKNQLSTFLKDLKEKNYTIVGYGAPAKGNTLLNICNINNTIIDYIVDDSPLKVGLYTPASHIPVESSNKLNERLPDYILILAWNFSEEILEKTKKYAELGVKFIIPLPALKIIRGNKMTNETIIKIEPAFSDERGEIANIIDKPISHVAIITSKKGSIRANHYHPEQTQYEFLISGRYESTSKDLTKEDSEVEVSMIEPNNLVITPPMIAHAMRFLEDSVMLNITTGSRHTEDFENHTKKYKLIE